MGATDELKKSVQEGVVNFEGIEHMPPPGADPKPEPNFTEVTQGKVAERKTADAPSTPAPASRPSAPAGETPPPKTPVAASEDRIQRMIATAKEEGRKVLQAEADRMKPGPISLDADTKSKVDKLNEEGKYTDAMILVQEKTGGMIGEITQKRTQLLQQGEAFIEGRAKAMGDLYKAHPDLLEFHEAQRSGKPGEETEFVKQYNALAREYPEVLNNPKGVALLAEKAALRIGIDKAVDEEREAGRKAEADRAATALAASGASGSSTPAVVRQSRQVELTPDQIRIAKRLRLTPAEYAESAGMEETGSIGGGVVLSSAFKASPMRNPRFATKNRR